MAQSVYCKTHDSIEPYEKQAMFQLVWRDSAKSILYSGM